MRPDRLVVGECRGAELRELLAALNTGHDGGAGTLHANSLADVPARLEALGALAGLDAGRRRPADGERVRPRAAPRAGRRQAAARADRSLRAARRPPHGRSRCEPADAASGRAARSSASAALAPASRPPPPRSDAIAAVGRAARRAALGRCPGAGGVGACRRAAIGASAGEGTHPAVAMAAGRARRADDRGDGLAAAAAERPPTRLRRRRSSRPGRRAEASAAWPVLAAAWAVAAESGAPLAASLRELAARSATRRSSGARCEPRSPGPMASARLVTGAAARRGGVRHGARLRHARRAVRQPDRRGLPRRSAPRSSGRRRRWSTRARRARGAAHDADAGLELELLAIAMSGGASVERARRIVRQALGARRGARGSRRRGRPTP